MLTAAQRHKAGITMAGREGQTCIQVPMGLEGIHTHTHKTRAYIPKAESRNRDGPQSEDHNIKDRH